MFGKNKYLILVVLHVLYDKILVGESVLTNKFGRPVSLDKTDITSIYQ